MGSLQKLLVMFDLIQFSLYFTYKIKLNFVGFLQNGLQLVQLGNIKCRLNHHQKFKWSRTSTLCSRCAHCVCQGYCVR